MKRILLVFRGETNRWNNYKYHDVRGCIPNNKKRIIDALRAAGHQVTIFFCTYDSQYLHSFVEAYTPDKVFLMDYNGSSQHKNFKFVLDCVQPVVDQFDQIIVLRFDFLYKKDIPTWGLLDQPEGHVFLWKDASKEAYEERKYCMDGLFLLDARHFTSFKQLYDENYVFWKDITWGLHFLTTLLYNCQLIPYHFLEGDTYWSSNTSLNDPTHKNPYLLNFIYKYHHDDFHLTNVE